MVGAIASAAAEILKAIVGAIQSLPQKLLEIAKKAGEGISSGLKGMLGAIKGAATSILSGIVSASHRCHPNS